PGRDPLTYRQLVDQVDQTSESLKLSGVTCGDRVAIVLPAGPELATAFLAISSMATSIPLNPAYREQEFDFYLSDLQPKAIIVPAARDLPVSRVAEKYGIEVIELNASSEAASGTFTLTAPKHDFSGERRSVQDDDIALVLYTSGTTSKPKRVPLTQRNL